MPRFLRITLKILAVLVALFALLQLVPYGRTHSNGAIIREPAWDSPRTRALAVRACFNCHSNETTWPWYSNVAPFSWVVEFDVNTAREVINFSEWDKHYDLAAWSGWSVRTGNMPTVKYRMAHKEAQLTDQEIKDLAAGLDATFGSSNEPPPEN